MKQFKADHRLASLYYPITNRKVENLNGVLGSILTKLYIGNDVRL